MAVMCRTRYDMNQKDGRRTPGKSNRLPFVPIPLYERIRAWGNRHDLNISDSTIALLEFALNQDETEIVTMGEMVAESETH